MFKKYFSIIIVALVLVLSSCSKDSNPTNTPTETTYTGASVALGNGTATCWVKMNTSGVPVQLGLSLSEGALVSLPDTMASYIVPLPSKALVTGFNHISLDWNPMGHEPSAIYGLPHFDFHFYLISQEERMMITAMGSDTNNLYQNPGAGYLAAGYMLMPGTGVPMMGAHALDVTSPELNGAKFTETLIYGYYKGSMVFVEPMITLEYLNSKPTLMKMVKMPAKFAKTGYYPSYVNVNFNSTNKNNMIILDSLQMKM
ncbi:MAG: hypothetical protein HW421_3555 [Ignavibacteria bacterium]|nr:hypothetical protein [Ignavibacteria bacterium]